MSIVSNTISFIVSPAKTIDKNTKIPVISGEIECTPQTIERINNLGLKSIAFNKYEENSKVLKTLEMKMWDKASLLKDRIIKKDADFINAINFLEIFAMYSLQAELNRVGNFGTDELKLKKTKDSEVQEFSPVTKLVNVLESLATMNIHGDKSEKKIIRKQIERAVQLVDKIFTQNLSKTEAKGLIKQINKAEKILKKFS